MPDVRFTFDGGYVSSRGIVELEPGELQTASGIYYPRGTKTPKTQRGQTTFGDTSTSAEVQGVALLLYDTGGTDIIVALSNGTLYSATPGASGTFSSKVTGLSTSASVLARAHYNDKWYLGNGYDDNRVVESDGTVYTMSMKSPVERIIATASDSSGTATISRPDALVGTTDFADEADGRDADLTTFASSTQSSAGSTTIEYEFTTANSDANRKLNVRWQVAGGQFLGDSDDWDFGHGGSPESSYSVDVKIEYSEDNGSTYSTLVEQKAIKAPTSENVSQISVSADNDQVHVKVTYTYNAGNLPATLRLYDVNIQDGSTAATFSTTTGFYYGVAEYDASRRQMSSMSAAAVDGSGAELITLSSQNQVSLTMPSAAQNTRTTHWRVFRTFDGGSFPQDCGLIAEVDVGESTFIDDFSKDKDETHRPLVPLLRVDDQTSGSALYFSRDEPAPAFESMTLFDGSLCGLSNAFTRALYYSQPGRPESFPEINVVNKFPWDEHDNLIGVMSIGETLFLLADGAVGYLTELPRVTQGVFNAASVKQLSGQPGCTGRNAFTTFSLDGVSSGAWISRYGIHVTDGFRASRISQDLNWSTEVNTSQLGSAVLRWDPDWSVLICAVPTGGSTTPTKVFYFHMAPEHRKQNGRPLITYAERSVNDLAIGEVSGVKRIYSAHTSDGTVRLEESGSGVASTLRSGRFYNDWKFATIQRAKTRFRDFQDHNTGTLTWTVGDDSEGFEESVSSTLDLDTVGSDETFILRMGEWHEVEVSHPANAIGSFIDVSGDFTSRGRTGDHR